MAGVRVDRPTRDCSWRFCPDCVNYLASYRAATALERSAFSRDEGSLPRDVPAEHIQTILAAFKHDK